MCETICLLLFQFLLCFPLAMGHPGKSHNRYEDMEGFDPIQVTRCDASCGHTYNTEREMCHNLCMSSNFTKLGSCSVKNFELSVFVQACINECHDDSKCPEEKKCCAHSCGITCQTPEFDTEVEQQLPAIPLNVTAKELKGKSVVEISWHMKPQPTRNTLFIVQSRSHVGRYFSEHYLSPWESIFQTGQNNAVLKNVLLTARWYTFRVAAVDEKGTRGFSSSSEPFSLSKNPSKPLKPKRLCVVDVKAMAKSKKVQGVVRWSRPRSELPIKRYKVFWSLRLPGHRGKSTNASDSVLMHQRSVPTDKLNLQVDNLERNELYFIQVQAFSVFGREKLKGSKANMIFNTTYIADQCAPQDTSKKYKKITKNV